MMIMHTTTCLLLLASFVARPCDGFSTTRSTTALSPPQEHLHIRSSSSLEMFVSKITYHSQTRINARDRMPNKSLMTSSTSLGGVVLPEVLSNLAPTLLHPDVAFLPSFGLNAFLFAVLRTKLLKMLTPTGFVHALILGTGLWTTLGWKGWTLAVAYLFLGSAVTKVKFAEKEEKGIAEGRGGRRGAENVWGSAATALGCAIAATRPIGDKLLFGIPTSMYRLGFVASLATKLADTFASEIGKAYGKTAFLITTLKRVEPGTEGAVSLEGTAAAVVGGLLLSLYGFSIGLIDSKMLPISVIASFLATNFESVLGATIQGKKNLEWVTNDVVNFINTLVGAIIAISAGLAFL